MSGPPWILGARGVPMEAPENTLAGFRRAFEIGLDGVAYELCACRSGEAIVFADETLERTTDGAGLVAQTPWVELSSLDAGGAFHARHRGEPIPLFEEAIELCAENAGSPSFHWIEIADRSLVSVVAPALRSLASSIAPRIASYSRDVCLDARDADLPAVLLAHRASERHRQFVADAKLAGFGTGPAGWRAVEPEWPCERWTIGADAPLELEGASRAGSFGWITREPRRALAIRALRSLAPHDAGAYPVLVSELEMGTAERGWFGSFESRAQIRNPFAFAARVHAELVLRRGAFEVEGLPLEFDLAPGEARDVPFRLTGGSWRAGRDPIVSARYTWRASKGVRGGSLTLDAPVHRRRTSVLDSVTRRLPMLRESPADPPASMTLCRHRGYLLASIEDAGGLVDPHTIVHLDGRTHHGGRGLRARLPEDFDSRAEGVPFSCGIWAVKDGERVVRRWAGGVPDEIESGAPGRLLSAKLA